MNKLLQSLSALRVSATLVTLNLNAEATINTEPQLKGVNNTVIEKGQKYNLLKGVSVYDKGDGDLIRKIKIDGQVDTPKVGKYRVKHQVTDSDSVKETSIRDIEVK